MAKGPSYRVPFRRRREGKTDYKARRALVSSRLPRVVTRASLKHATVQIIEAHPNGDRVIASASSHELGNYGWKAPCGNIPSAYLTGLLCGKRAVAKKVTKAVSDIGLNQPTKGACVFASIKGTIDAGVDVPHRAETLPQESRIKGKHIADHAELLASANPELYERQFSTYLAKKIHPQKLLEHFEATRQEISSPTAGRTLEKKRKTAKKGIAEAKMARKRTAKKEAPDKEKAKMRSTKKTVKKRGRKV